MKISQEGQDDCDVVLRAGHQEEELATGASSDLSKKLLPFAAYAFTITDTLKNAADLRLTNNPSKTHCLSPGQIYLPAEAEMSACMQGTAPHLLTQQHGSAATALPSDNQCSLAGFRDREMKQCARSMASSKQEILQLFYDLTDNLYYTKGPLWFISYIPVKNKPQC